MKDIEKESLTPNDTVEWTILPLAVRIHTALCAGCTWNEVTEHFVGTDISEHATPEDVFLALAAARILMRMDKSLRGF